MKKITLLTIVLCSLLLVTVAVQFPDWGDPQSPAARHVSAHYIEHTIEETSVPNIVTAVLADYRGFDTMFETAVIFAAGIACMFMLRHYRSEEPPFRLYRHIATGITLRISRGGKIPDDSDTFERIDSVWTPHDVIIQTTARLFVPFIQLFGLYVIAHGHHSPGGGFQGGVILGAAAILFAVSYNLRTAQKHLSERSAAFGSITGMVIYAGTGTLSLLLGKYFLDYGALARLLGVDAVTAHSHGILMVEIGVGLAVMTVMVGLYYNLASRGRHDEGL